MAPPNLQGLNIVHPAENHNFDSQDLLSGNSFPDLNAQLDLWTHLPFESEEGASQVPLEDYHHKKRHISAKEREDEEQQHPEQNDSHVNVINPPQQFSSPHFDIASFLSGFNLDANALQQQQQQQQPSLAQLLALAQNPSVGYPGIPHLPAPAASSFSHSQRETSAAPPPAKRARSRKASVSTTVVSSPSAAESPDDGINNGSSLTPAEDKRRRNTAASARFRLKKKEREAALEGKAKELEQRVSDLERECEGLRRENGWLKGLVVGVTGAAQGSVVPQPPQQGLKRPREDDN